MSPTDARDARNTLPVSWREVEYQVRYIAQRIPPHINYIYPLPRGGLVPGVMLSHVTGIELLTTYLPSARYTLIIDDVYDTGRTLDDYLRRGYTCACLYYKQARHQLPKKHAKYLLYTHAAPHSAWLVFPWELGRENNK